MPENEDRDSPNVEDLLKELETEAVPEMDPSFEADAMKRIARRRRELDAEEAAQAFPKAYALPAAKTKGPERTGAGKDSRPGAGKGRLGRNTWLSIAAALVFLIGGTLLTRDRLRPKVPSGQPEDVIQSTALRTDGQEEGSGAEPGKEAEPGGIALFLEDMGLFLKAAVPYLTGAGAAAAVLLLVRGKDKRGGNAGEKQDSGE